MRPPHATPVPAAWGTEVAGGLAPEAYARLASNLASQPAAWLATSAAAAYDRVRADDVRLRGRLLGFDWLPRVVSAGEWALLARGSIQRLRALHAFTLDFHAGGASIVPDVLLKGWATVGDLAPSPAPPVHLYAPDFVRGPDGVMRVIEDNLGHAGAQGYSRLARSYQRTYLPALFEGLAVSEAEDFGASLGKVLDEVADPGDGLRCYLWPGAEQTSEAYEAVGIAAAAGMRMIRPADLAMDRDGWLVTGSPPRRVAAVQVRVRPDDPVNALLLAAARAGRTVVLSAHANRIGGDKAVMPFVPRMIRHYLGEEPVLEQVESVWLGEDSALEEVRSAPDRWVVKRRIGVGGWEVLIVGDAAPADLLAWMAAVEDDPAAYVAQRFVEGSTHACLTPQAPGEPELRTIDLRLYVVAGASARVPRLGLTRRAPAGAHRTNLAHPGAAVKDTWILDEAIPPDRS